MRERVLDWKPFDYFTVEQENRPMGLIRVTFQLEPLEDNRTRLSTRITGGVQHVPDFIGRPAIRYIFTRLFDYHSFTQAIKKVIEANAAPPSPDTDV